MSKELNGSKQLSITNHKGEELVLNEEETLAKFKEIWGRAFAVGKYINMLDSEEQEWEEFKQTL